MKILVLAGGYDQIALIKELKKRGNYTILVDYFKNPPARQYADKHIVASTLDIDAVSSIAIEESVDLVTTACTDQALLTVAKVSENLNLPCYISYDIALKVTNKMYMKSVFFKAGIPTSHYAIISNSRELNSLSNFTYPLVVKPVDCNSSKGVKKILSNIDLSDKLNDAISMSRTHTAIVEEYIDGEELSIDAYVEGTKAKLLCVTGSKKIKNNNNSFTILQSCYPVISKDEEIVILSIVQQIVNAFNLRDTPLLVQAMKQKCKYYVLEFSARMGGGSKYRLIQILTGVDIMSVYVDRVLGKTNNVYPEKKVNYARMIYVYCCNGVFMKIAGMEKLKAEGIVLDSFQYKTEGSIISGHDTSSDRIIGYLIIANTHNELMRKMEISDKTLMVLDNESQDIMIHNLL